MADITQMIADLRTMVNDTINPDNGLKSITGSSMNLAMNALIDAIATAASTGGGGGAEIVYATVSQDSYPLTQEQITANIAVWQKAKDAYEQGKTLPPVIIDLSSAYSAISQANMAYVINPIQLMGAADETGEEFGLAVMMRDYMNSIYVIELVSDGLATMQSMS